MINYLRLHFHWLIVVFAFTTSCQDQENKDYIIDSNKAKISAKIVRTTLGPKEKAVIHYTFVVDGQTYSGSQWINVNVIYKVGEEISIDYAKNNPEYNRVSEK